jgi:hypothetical protein
MYKLKHNDSKGAKDMLDRSLKSLEKHKHIRAITQFAIAEYDFGSEERARTILEGTLAVWLFENLDSRGADLCGSFVYLFRRDRKLPEAHRPLAPLH